MMEDYNGKRVEVIYWPGDESLKAIEGERDLICHYDYHGGYGEYWIVEMKNGKEVAIHNMRFIESIRLKP